MFNQRQASRTATRAGGRDGEEMQESEAEEERESERERNNPTVLVFYPFPHPAQNLIVPFLICHKPIHKKALQGTVISTQPRLIPD